jgi:undecaprenyl diphosphate synthase
MRLYEVFIERYLQDALQDNVRLVHLGRKDRLPKSLLTKITNAEEKTKHHDQYTLNVALDYGGHDEIIRAIKKVNEQNVENLDEEIFANFLDTHDQPHPNPDLIIRTSGEQRISGFMPWQAAYSEYLFLNKYFPDMNEQDMEDAAKEFQNRQRRFGK